MKNKLSRILVLLVAIAMMIPTFALAENVAIMRTDGKPDPAEAYLVVGDTEQADCVTKGKEKDYGFTYRVENPALVKGLTVVWTSTNASVATVGNGNEFVEVLPDDKTLVEGLNVPAIIPKGVGTTEIKGQIVSSTEVPQTAAIAFKVALKEWPITAVATKETSRTASLDYIQNHPSIVALFGGVTVTPATATYADARQVWTLVDAGTTGATLNQAGQLTVQKAGTLTAKVSVNGVESKPVTLEIIDGSVDPTETTYKSLTFTTTSFTVDVNDNPLNLNSYLVKNPINADETLTWDSSDESIAQVFGGRVYPVNKSDTPVTITVKGKEASATATVKVTALEKVPYTELKLSKTEATVDAGDDEEREYYYVGQYLTTTPDDSTWEAYEKLIEAGKIVDDDIIWTTDKQPQVVVDNLGLVSWLPSAITEDTKVTVTAYTRQNKATPVKFTLTIKKAAAKQFEKVVVRDDFKALTMKLGSTIYLSRYVYGEPAGAADTLQYTSNNPDVVYIDDADRSEIYAAGVGEAEITVRSKKNPNAAFATIKVTVVDDEVKAVKFVNPPKKVEISNNDFDLSDYVVTDPKGIDLIWDSSDPTVATVYPDGVLDIKKVGKATITVSDLSGKFSDKAEIEFYEAKPVQAITLKDVTLKVGETLAFVENWATVTPADSDFDPRNLAAKSSDRDVAEVICISDDDADIILHNFAVVGYKAGTATITLIYKNEDGTTVTGSCKVTVVAGTEIKGIDLATKKYTLKLWSDYEKTVKFNLDPIDADYKDGDLYVVSSNKSVASVVEDGLLVNAHGRGCVKVQAKKPGSAWFSIKNAEGTTLGRFKVKVETVAVKKVNVPKKTIKLNWYDDGIASNHTYKNTYTLKPVINPSNAYYTVSYETSDPSVAFVQDKDSLEGSTTAYYDPSAEIVASGIGTATITVKVDDGVKVRTASVKVVVTGKTLKTENTDTVKKITGDGKVKVKVGETKELDIKVKPEGAKVTFKSSDKNVVKVSKDGKIKGINKGKATVTVSGDGVEFVVKVTVK